MIDASSPARTGDEVLIFQCASGACTKAYAAKLAASAPCEVYVLEGRTFGKKDRHESGEVRSLVVLPGFSVKLADVFRT